MRIAVNLLPFRQQLAGAGRYTQNILRELVGMDTTNEYWLLVAPRAAAHFSFAVPNLRQILIPLPEATVARIAAEQLLPVQLVRQDIDVLLTPSVAIPLAWRGKKVTVIYDMMAEQGALKKYPRGRSLYVRWMSRYAARHSNTIITISENSRRDIAAFAHVPPGKILVAPPAADLARVTDTERLEEVRERYRLPPRFILYVGTLEPGKNLPFLIRAFARMKQMHPDLEQHLVLGGAQGWGVRELEAEIAKSDAMGFHLLGFVEEQDLAALYSLADVFVFPSLYEGFGIPPLEAMACGTPVIVSNVSALPEVLGDLWTGKRAGMLASPTDEHEWAEAMARVLMDEALAAKLRAAGAARAAEFSWKGSARVVRDALAAIDEGFGSRL